MTTLRDILNDEAIQVARASLKETGSIDFFGVHRAMTGDTDPDIVVTGERILYGAILPFRGMNPHLVYERFIGDIVYIGHRMVFFDGRSAQRDPWPEGLHGLLVPDRGGYRLVSILGVVEAGTSLTISPLEQNDDLYQHGFRATIRASSQPFKQPDGNVAHGQNV
ncbi:hypothetical protein HY480_03440, partial [Candidatus Uhrbacteria bacterium]|nr:hypothetical protein [Candidatus Uhrbacteria bacterium]